MVSERFRRVHRLASIDRASDGGKPDLGERSPPAPATDRVFLAVVLLPFVALGVILAALALIL